ncbi:MAG: hypothetical protein AAF481_18835 [Acidobacteriota bacterium]
MRKLFLSAVLGVLLLLFLEIVSFGLFWWREGEAFRWSRTASQRAEVGRVPQAEDAPPPAIEEEIQAFKDEVVQPFLGFVIDPGSNVDRDGQHLIISPEGFFRRRNPFPQPSDDPLHIGVLGGSVAFIFAFRGGEVLVDNLLERPELAARGVVVDSWGLGGYKQPQQLMTLNWVLARGYPLDVVINLDGFNDIALAQTENRYRKVSPFYPRSWNVRVEGLPTGEAAALVGRAAYEQERRRALARSFSQAPWRWSVTANLVWRSLDARAVESIAEAQVAAAAAPAADGEGNAGDFVARGPAYTYRKGDQPKVAEELVAFWERSSRLMAGLCDSQGIPYFHFLQPNQYPEGAKPLSSEERRVAYSENRPYRAVVQGGYQMLRDAGARLAADGIAFHDLSMLFADVRETLYIDDCCHLNQRGNELMAAAIVEILMRELPEKTLSETTRTATPAEE